MVKLVGVLVGSFDKNRWVKMGFSIVDVVNNGICVGCGGCRVATGGRIEIGTNEHLTFVANLGEASSADLELADGVCPFSDAARDEDVIAAGLFGSDLHNYDQRTGYYRSLRVGRMQSDDVTRSSSGGLTTYLLGQLLDAGEVDGIIHVGETINSDLLFSYTITETKCDLEGRRKSQYYPCQFSDAMLAVRGNGKQYAIVGVPCFIKASRLLIGRDPVLRGQLKYHIALCCGHLKSAAFAEAMAWQLGIPPNDLARVDFRWKVEGASANSYSFGAVARSDGKWRTAQSNSLLGGNWGHALFQLGSCNFCDDIFGETADICFGDAWLPSFDREWRGTNIVVSRNAVLDRFLTAGSERKHIWLDDLSVNNLINSQSGAFRHRWFGMSVRLAEARRRGEQVPLKRKSSYLRRVSFFRRQIVLLRQRMSRESHGLFLKAKRRGEFSIFSDGLNTNIKIMKMYERLGNLTRPSYVLRWIRDRILNIAPRRAS
jgi:coenzyme F420 hydrogenase subunit beta